MGCEYERPRGKGHGEVMYRDRVKVTGPCYVQAFYWLEPLSTRNHKSHKVPYFGTHNHLHALAWEKDSYSLFAL